MFQQRSSNTNGNVDAYSLAWKLMTYVPAQHRTVPEEGGKWFRNDDRNQTCVERCNPRTIQLTSPAPHCAMGWDSASGVGTVQYCTGVAVKNPTVSTTIVVEISQPRR